MAVRLKKNLVLLFFILAGVIIGALIGNMVADIPALSWLGYGQTVGISADNPVAIDLLVLVFSFGLQIHVTVAQILTITGALLVYRSVIGKL